MLCYNSRADVVRNGLGVSVKVSVSYLTSSLTLDDRREFGISRDTRINPREQQSLDAWTTHLADSVATRRGAEQFDE